MSDIFISYTEEDTDIALEIALGLEKAGHATWCYELDCIPGLSYIIQTIEAIEGAPVFVLIISTHSLGSRQISSEVIHAYEENKSFIPVLLDITNDEIQNRQPEWAEILGSDTSINILLPGVASILPRIIDRLKTLNIRSRVKRDPKRINQIANILNEQKSYSVSKKYITPEPKSLTLHKSSTKATKRSKERRLMKPALIVLATIAIIALIVLGTFFFVYPKGRIIGISSKDL